LEDPAKAVYGMGMTPKPNPRQLVLRRDTATGLTLIGWEEDLPVGRFEHLELICESADNSLPDNDSEDYRSYQSAIAQARQANTRMLDQQVQQHQAQGWYPVPFALAQDAQTMKADRVGNYAAAAMQLHYQLTRNCQQAWVIVRRGVIVHVRARYPKKALDELTYQVWYHKQQHELNQLDGTLLEGTLVSCESGLWFVAK
jgi:hypothetical protein